MTASPVPSDAALLLLAFPSVGVLVLLAAAVARGYGRRAAAAWLGTAAVYGFLRGLAIRGVLAPLLGSPPPYLMRSAGPRLLGVSAQEVVGWCVAATLAWLLAERLSARLGGGPFRTALVSAGVLGAVCLAVESAATASGWWIWTLRLPQGPVRVPPVALLDWAFVAFDLVLPWLLFRARAPWRDRAAGLILFPLHFASHAFPAPLPLLGLSPFELVHAGIVLWALDRALGERTRRTAPDARLAALSGLAVAACCVAALARVGAPPQAFAAILPLVLLSLIALRAAPASTPLPEAGGALRTAVVLAGALALVLWRVPRARVSREFSRSIARGAALLARGDCTGADREFRRAVALRPEHPAGYAAAARAALCAGRPVDARRELEAALLRQPTSPDALLLLASLDLREGRRDEALAHAELGARVHPGRREFADIAEAARRGAGAPR